MRRTLVVKFSENKILYGISEAVALGDTNIPDSFNKFKPNVCWALEVLNYDEAEGTLYAKILSYDSSQYSYSSQAHFIGHIKKITFNHIDTTNLLNCTERSQSSFPRKSELNAKTSSFSNPKQLRNQPSQAPLETTIKNKLTVAPPAGKDILLPATKEILYKTEKVTLHVKVPFVNLEYYDGYVCFKYRPYKHLAEIKVRTNNDFIKSQFDCVSKYIGKQIGKNTAEFILALEVKTDEYGKEVSCSLEKVVSQEIERINQDIIDKVKFTHTFDLIFSKRLKVDDASRLKTSDDFFDDNIDTNLHPSVKDPRAILEKAFEFKKSKHYLQLKYLADKHKSSTFKLRFSVRPFSFLFLIEGEVKDYFVLETYDENLATYIWSAEKEVVSIKLKFKEIEALMLAFEETHRMKYLSSKPDGFFRIIHDYINDVDGFNSWKDKFDKIII